MNNRIAPLSTLLKRLWRHLDRRRQVQFRLIILLTIISAIAEIVSLGSVLPFLGVVVAPESVFQQPFVYGFARTWGINSPDQLVLPLSIAFAVAATLAGVIRMLLLWVSTRFAYGCGGDLSFDAYRRTLYQPYQTHVARNSSEVISAINNKVDGAINVLSQAMTFISSCLLLAALALTLIAIEPAVAFFSILGFGSIYGLITWFSRRRLYLNSLRIAHEQTRLTKALQEGLGGIRDVLLDGTQSIYCETYHQANYPFRLAQGKNTFITICPRYAIEALAMVLIATLTYALSHPSGGIIAALPVLGAMALGAQRLLPALQQTYGAWAFITGSRASMEDVLEMLDQPVPEELLLPSPPPLPLKIAIQFNDVSFRYTPEDLWVLDGLNLTISKGARIGLVGSTGSGKSTLLDLLLGLLTPSGGEILVDGQALVGNRLRAWQRNIAHVPQSIFLADSTLAENIAFGVKSEAIDMQRVQQAAVQAQIAEYIHSRPEGYSTYVGERGIRLSGGQRQRIGIARALYKQASILVFDEATSALDNATEQSLMDAIEKLDRSLTIVIIAHRLTTLRRCDSIFELADGHVVAQGSYENLVERSTSFRNMVESMVMQHNQTA